jgi:micrococcal nuclease
MDAPFFSLNGTSTSATIVKVYDGDTVHAVFDFMGKTFKWKCRIAHVDTPELRTKNEEEKKKGVAVRDQLSELILNKVVHLDCQEFDKYGRLLVEITLPETNVRVHEWLIQNGHAKAYEGGTKSSW